MDVIWGSCHSGAFAHSFLSAQVDWAKEKSWGKSAD
jgi:hypothetical protein